MKRSVCVDSGNVLPLNPSSFASSIVSSDVTTVAPFVFGEVASLPSDLISAEEIEERPGPSERWPTVKEGETAASVSYSSVIVEAVYDHLELS